MKDELLIVSKEKEKLKFKVVEREVNRWSPERYSKIIKNKDFNLIAYLLYDLYCMGYPIDKAHAKFREMINEPDLFFLK